MAKYGTPQRTDGSLCDPGFIIVGYGKVVASVLWILLGWTDGASAVILAAVACSFFAVHQMAAVELGADLYGQIAIAQRLRSARAVRGGLCEVAAQTDKHLGAAFKHGVDGFNNVMAVVTGHLELETAVKPLLAALGTAGFIWLATGGESIVDKTNLITGRNSSQYTPCAGDFRV